MQLEERLINDVFVETTKEKEAETEDMIIV